MTADLHSRSERLIDRYAQMPTWVLLLQLFLAFGWARAAVDHATSPDWWNGDEVLDFIDSYSGTTVAFYEPFLREVVGSVPSVTAAIVIGLQLVIIVSLACNFRTTIGLTVGAFLNLQLMFGGAVNPSVFYLVSTLAILAWRLEAHLSPLNSQQLVQRIGGVTMVFALMLTPRIRTLDPGRAVEDPALVLTFLSLLFAAVMGLAHFRLQHGAGHLGDLEPETTADHEEGDPQVARHSGQLCLFAGPNGHSRHDERDQKALELRAPERNGVTDNGDIELVFNRRRGTWHVIVPEYPEVRPTLNRNQPPIPPLSSRTG